MLIVLTMSIILKLLFALTMAKVTAVPGSPLSGIGVQNKINFQGIYASPGTGKAAAASCGSRCGAVITNTTAVKITVAATSVLCDSASPPSSQPMISATIGFTKAYVPTRAAVLFFNM